MKVERWRIGVKRQKVKLQSHKNYGIIAKGQIEKGESAESAKGKRANDDRMKCY